MSCEALPLLSLLVGLPLQPACGREELAGEGSGEAASGDEQKDQVGGLRGERRAQRIGRSRVSESRTQGPGSMYRPGSEGGRRAMGLEEPGRMGELVRKLVTTQSEQSAGTLTAWMTTDGKFSHFLVDKDKKAVGSSTEPP